MDEFMKQKIFRKNIFDIIAPGHALRTSIDRIQEASLGALIILSEYDDIKHLTDGGFILNTDFSPQKIYELAKMDGAIIINRSITTILGANIQMQPNSRLITDESGTRHRTAHRLAQETGDIVIAVSERRNKITIFQGDNKYILVNLDDLLIKSSQALNSLEKYAEIVNKYLHSLNFYEMEGSVTIEEIINGLRHFSLLFAMKEEVKQYIQELGIEGRLIKLQYDEIMENQKSTCISFLKDYYNPKKDILKDDKLFLALLEMEEVERYNNDKLLSLIGYDKNCMLEKNVNPRGYRFLNNIDKITKKEIESTIENFQELPNLIMTTSDELNELKIFSKVKVRRIMRYISRYKNEMELYKDGQE